ncbi:MAG: sugar phosphate nucleotidyltransferase [Candidatus Nanohaloarchaea archaeon]
MPKQRVSLTLEESLVERVDGEAGRKDVNRSQMVEKILDSYFKRKGVETAVVFCGDPETKTLELHDGKPVLSHVLDHLSEEGISRVMLLVGQNDEIEDNFGSEYSGIALEYVYEEEPRGTAAALKQIEEKIGETFVAMNGHVIADVDIQDMLNVHGEEGNVATMALTAVEDPSNYGVARLKGRKVLGFADRPESGEEPSRLINAGTYILSPEIFSRLEADSMGEVFKQLASESELTGYIYGGKWQEIDD